ncbi:hypothetical protein [Thauera humireducens]|uniref:hypothetical protein n=1 Tax=Thauera humireducens TaxID=1134435 RepID=UPI003C747622
MDYETVAKWAEGRQILFTHFRSLVEHPEVRALIDAEIARGNAQLAQVSHIRRFHLLTKELDHDDGEVTATMKVRRSSIYKTYADVIEAMYRERGRPCLNIRKSPASASSATGASPSSRWIARPRATALTCRWALRCATPSGR